MDKEKAIQVMLKRFKDIPENAKFIFYNNPNKFKHFIKEPVNPNHIHYIRGNRKDRKSRFIKVAKLILPSFGFFTFDKVITNTIISFLLYITTVLHPETFIVNLVGIIFTTYLIINIYGDKDGMGIFGIYNNNGFIRSIFCRKTV